MFYGWGVGGTWNGLMACRVELNRPDYEFHGILVYGGGRVVG